MTYPAWMSYVPGNFHPYIELARLHYFLGPNLFFWPCAWGLTLGALHSPISIVTLFKQLFLYHLIGGLLLHSIAATWNDICDKDFDGRVERTKNRPIPSGRVTVSQAYYFLIPQVVIMGVLLTCLNNFAMWLGFIGFFWNFFYPFMKRVTYWPQAWLGVAGNWGMLVTYSSLTNTINAEVITFFIGACCWCIHYDTVYAMMDRDDDIKIGISSTALLFQDYERQILACFASVFISSLFMLGHLIDANSVYYCLTVGGTALHLVWQLTTVDFRSSNSCYNMFLSNGKQVGYIVWAGIFVEYLTNAHMYP